MKTNKYENAVLGLYLNQVGSNWGYVSTEDVAKLVGVSVATARKYLHLARKNGMNISHKASESQGRGMGKSAESWEPTKFMLAERLALAFAWRGMGKSAESWEPTKFMLAERLALAFALADDEPKESLEKFAKRCVAICSTDEEAEWVNSIINAK